MGAARRVLAITGTDRHDFLQGLVTNEVPKAPATLVYAALLTAQGKYLSDFFLTETGEAILLDADADQAADLMRRLTMYKLRAKVAIETPDGIARHRPGARGCAGRSEASGPGLAALRDRRE